MFKTFRLAQAECDIRNGTYGPKWSYKVLKVRGGWSVVPVWN